MAARNGCRHEGPIEAGRCVRTVIVVSGVRGGPAFLPPVRPRSSRMRRLPEIGRMA